MSTKYITILGATGSVGKNALEVVDELDGFEVYAISGRSNVALLQAQAEKYPNARVVAADRRLGSEFDFGRVAAERVLFGPENLVKMATAPEVDIVVAAIMGRAGLESTLAAVKAGKRVALANKETLVLAGCQVTQAAAAHQAEILPVDSEHSAVFQAVQAGKRSEIRQIILTASGGPFRDHSLKALESVTVEQALAHPTWKMGRKISVDSATMMNKALEIIEARWLFDLPPSQIRVAIHPQSIIHSLVEFNDRSVLAQMSPPDMKLPIQYALTYPFRVPGPSPAIDFSEIVTLELRPPDLEKFPALRLGYEVAEQGGTCGAILNAANEAAVQAFLDHKMAFLDIVKSCEEVLKQHHFEPNPSLETLMECDHWAREEINKWISC